MIIFDVMKLLKKRKPEKLAIKKPLSAIDLVGQMVENKMLRTTAYGAFYTFPEILKIGPTPENIVKNMYLYARACKLIDEGQPLYIRHIEDDYLIGQYDLKNGYVPAP